MRTIIALAAALFLAVSAHAGEWFDRGFADGLAAQQSFMSHSTNQNKEEAQTFAVCRLTGSRYESLQEYRIGYWTAWEMFFKTLPEK